MTPAVGAVAVLRDRLLAVAEALDAGLLRVLADAEIVLAALDRDG